MATAECVICKKDGLTFGEAHAPDLCIAELVRVRDEWKRIALRNDKNSALGFALSEAAACLERGHAERKEDYLQIQMFKDLSAHMERFTDGESVWELHQDSDHGLVKGLAEFKEEQGK